MLANKPVSQRARGLPRLERIAVTRKDRIDAAHDRLRSEPAEIDVGRPNLCKIVADEVWITHLERPRCIGNEKEIEVGGSTPARDQGLVGDSARLICMMNPYGVGGGGGLGRNIEIPIPIHMAGSRAS